jgi:glycosyltransferase involved in cell wall biosynthesis
MLDPWFKLNFPLKHLKKWLYWPWADYRVLRDARAVLFTCVEEMEASRRSFWMYRCRERIAALGVAELSTGPVAPKEAFFGSYPDLRGKNLLLFVGRLHPIKGCDLLLEAFAGLARRDDAAHLVMVGPDQVGWLAGLKVQAERLGISARVTWTGMLHGDQKWSAYDAASVLCLPSHHENFGMVIAEAMACGKPVLISNKVNIWREIEADGAGIVQDDTLEGTIRGLEQWLALTPQDKQKMQQSARRSFDARFRIDRVVESLINVLQEGVAANANSRCLDAGVELT